MMNRDEVRALLDRSADRDLDELEAKRLAAALDADPDLAAELLEDPAFDAALREEAIPLPTEAEWERLDREIAAATVNAAEGPAAPARPASRRVALWKVLVPLAAAAVLCAVAIRSILTEGLAPPESPIVEVDLPDERPYLILPVEGEDGGVMIYITSG